MKATLVLTLCFDASRECSAEKADLFMKKLNSHLAGPYCAPIVLHADLKLHRSPMI